MHTSKRNKQEGNKEMKDREVKKETKKRRKEEKKKGLITLIV